MVVRLLWLSGGALVAQAIGVLGSTPSHCQPFHFPLFSHLSIKISLLLGRVENATEYCYISIRDAVKYWRCQIDLEQGYVIHCAFRTESL